MIVSLSSAIGCGPVEYISGVTRKASSQVAAAKTVDAEKWAPYHYTRAVEYLEKAREEASRADYQAANRFGRIAHDDAVQAKELAIERRKSGTLPGPPSTSPEAPTDGADDPKEKNEDDRDHSEGEIIDAPEAGGS